MRFSIYPVQVLWLAELLPVVDSVGSVPLTAGWPSWRGWRFAAGIGWQDTHPMESHHSTEGALLLDLKETHTSSLRWRAKAHCFQRRLRGFDLHRTRESAAISSAFILCFRSIKAGVCVCVCVCLCVRGLVKHTASILELNLNPLEDAVQIISQREQHFLSTPDCEQQTAPATASIAFKYGQRSSTCILKIGWVHIKCAFKSFGVSMIL